MAHPLPQTDETCHAIYKEYNLLHDLYDADPKKFNETFNFTKQMLDSEDMILALKKHDNSLIGQMYSDFINDFIWQIATNKTTFGDHSPPDGYP